MEQELKIILTKRQRDLVSEFGYPFENIKQQIADNSLAKAAVEISDDSYWWEQLVGDLARSLNHNQVKGETLRAEVNVIADLIESSLNAQK